MVYPGDRWILGSERVFYVSSGRFSRIPKVLNRKFSVGSYILCEAHTKEFIRVSLCISLWNDVFGLLR